MAGIYVRACCGTSVNRYFAHTQYIHEMYELYGEVCCAVVSVDRFCKRTYIYILRMGTYHNFKVLIIQCGVEQFGSSPGS